MYRLTNGPMIVRISDGAFIPPDPKNVDYASYMAWLSQGGVPLPAQP